MARLDVKNLDDELYSKLRELSDKSGRSLSDIVSEAIRLYVVGASGIDKDVKGIINKVITVQFPSKCYKCGKQINQGDLAYYVRYVYADNTAKSFLYCFDCYLTEHDEALAKQYLTIRRLKAEIRGLKKLREKLASEVDRESIKNEIYSLRSELVKIMRDLRQLAVNVDISKIAELLDKVNYIESKLNELEEAIRLRIVVRAKKKEVVAGERY